VCLNLPQLLSGQSPLHSLGREEGRRGGKGEGEREGGEGEGERKREGGGREKAREGRSSQERDNHDIVILDKTAKCTLTSELPKNTKFYYHASR
jgi:hypothetical protein